MVTLCWAAKGGSGTTVVVATLALESTRPALIVDLDGDLPVVLGMPQPDRPGVAEWLATSGDPTRLDDLLIDIDDTTTLLPLNQEAHDLGDAVPHPVASIIDVDGVAAGVGADAHLPSNRLGSSNETTVRRGSRVSTRKPFSTLGSEGTANDPSAADERWVRLARWLADWEARHDGDVWVDGGTGTPPHGFAQAVDNRWLVTRACYLSVRQAARSTVDPTGVLLVDEPGRQLTANDIERSIAAPIVARLALDPSVARAVDAGLLMARTPRIFRRSLRKAIA